MADWLDVDVDSFGISSIITATRSTRRWKAVNKVRRRRAEYTEGYCLKSFKAKGLRSATGKLMTRHITKIFNVATCGLANENDSLAAP